MYRRNIVSRGSCGEHGFTPPLGFLDHIPRDKGTTALAEDSDEFRWERLRERFPL